MKIAEMLDANYFREIKKMSFKKMIFLRNITLQNLICMISRFLWDKIKFMSNIYSCTDVFI